ncbi:MAG: carbon-nitrogen hydrolase family protein [Verrucomicrobiota bacterium]
MSHFSIAGLQLDLKPGNNLDKIANEVRFTKAVYPWVDMVLLSELCVYGPDKANAQAIPGEASEFFAALARETGLYLVAGSIFAKDGDDILNLTLVYSPEGKEIARYAKMYPFEPYEAGITPGQAFCIFDIEDVGRFGVSICYDMWFPETTRALTWLGAEVILHPTMTGTLDRDAELSIARASAITNQVYFFDINGAGSIGNGRSVVIGSEGNVIHQAGSGREIIPVKIDLNHLRETREKGLMNLGQPLKSFRDHWRDFPQYQPGAAVKTFPDLGPLQKPGAKT